MKVNEVDIGWICDDTLRDIYAGFAMMVIFQEQQRSGLGFVTRHAEMAFDTAEYMMKERAVRVDK